MKRWWWTWGIIGVLAVGFAVWVGTRPEQPFDSFTQIAAANDGAVTAISAPGWSLETMTQDGEPCKRIRIDDTTTYCSSLQLKDGDWEIGTFAGKGHRFVVAVSGSSTAVTGRLWSDHQGAGGRHDDQAFTEIRPGIWVLVIDVPRGTAPWGLQMLAPDGRLLRADSLLPS